MIQKYWTANIPTAMTTGADLKIREMYRRFHAQDPEPNRPPRGKIYGDAFQSLVGVTLSAQTRDERTAEACQNLFARATTPEEILALDMDDLKLLIRPAGMYNNKARNLKIMSQQLLERHGGQVPSDRTDLMALAGVGRKSTDIMMRFVFNEPAIAVDTHVHRLANRLGLAHTRAEHQTAEILERDTPDQYRWGAHEWLIQHGKSVCQARNPRCDQCMLVDLCDYHQQKERV
jgi:endonuclease III